MVAADQHRRLDSILQTWRTRWRLQQAVRYLALIIIASLVIGTLMAVLLAWLPMLSATGLLVTVLGVIMATVIISLGGIALWQHNAIVMAQRFDRLLHLQARLVTAHELRNGRIQTTPALAQQQFDDTAQAMQAIDIEAALPLRVRFRDWVGVLGMALIFGIVLWWAMDYRHSHHDDVRVGEQTTAAIADAADTARDITEELAANSDLSDAERSTLLESVEQTLDDLNDPATNGEEAFVAMSQLEQDLRDEAQSIRQDAESQQADLQAATEQLNGDPANDNVSDQLDTMSDQVAEQDGLSQAEREAMIDDLRAAAEQVQASNPTLAEQFNQAADALETGNPDIAQETLSDAAQTAQTADTQAQSRQQTASDLEQAADQAADAAQEIASSEYQDQTDLAQTDAPQERGQQQQGANEGSAQQGAGPQPGEGEQGGEGQGDQSDQTGETGNPTDNDSAEAGNTLGEGEDSSPSAGDNPGQGENSGEGGSPNSNSNNSDNRTQEIVNGQDANQAGGEFGSDGGEGSYDALFAPDDIRVQDNGERIELDADRDETVVSETAQQNTPDSESRVPYNQVYQSYADSANQALDNGYVPLGMRDFVRDYFTSIEPEE